MGLTLQLHRCQVTQQELKSRLIIVETDALCLLLCLSLSSSSLPRPCGAKLSPGFGYARQTLYSQGPSPAQTGLGIWPVVPKL